MSDETKAASGAEVTEEDRACSERILTMLCDWQCGSGFNPPVEKFAVIVSRHRLASLAAKEAECAANAKLAEGWKRADNTHTQTLHELGDILAGRENNGYLAMDLIALARGLQAENQSLRQRMDSLQIELDARTSAQEVEIEDLRSRLAAAQADSRRLREALPYFAGWNASVQKYQVCHKEGRDADVPSFDTEDAAWREAERRSRRALPAALSSTVAAGKAEKT